MNILSLINSGCENITISVSPADLKEFALAIIDEQRKAMENARKQPKWLSAQETAERLGITKPTLWRWGNEGIIKGVKLGRFVRYAEDEVERVMQGESKPTGNKKV